MRTLSDFKDIHKGETCLLVGNADNLNSTLPEWFNYPSFGVNTIVEYMTWKPTYYVAVDRRVEREWGSKVTRRFGDITKFIPNRMGRTWSDETFIRWKNLPGPLWKRKNGNIWQSNIETEEIIYGNVFHVVMKIAFLMGFTKAIIIGMEHHPDNMKQKFWGLDNGMGSIPREEWLEGYRQIREAYEANGREIVNISYNTFVPEDILPRDDWRKYANI
jgi:hypothetical protein